MDALQQALAGSARDGAHIGAVRRPSALIVGAGDALGSALLTAALGAGCYASVAALIRAPMASAMRGFDVLTDDRLQASNEPLGFDVAFVVFERWRYSNGRDEAFVRPDASQLLPLATRLRGVGVRRL